MKKTAMERLEDMRTKMRNAKASGNWKAIKEMADETLLISKEAVGELDEMNKKRETSTRLMKEELERLTNFITYLVTASGENQAWAEQFGLLHTNAKLVVFSDGYVFESDGTEKRLVFPVNLLKVGKVVEKGSILRLQAKDHPRAEATIRVDSDGIEATDVEQAKLNKL